MKAEWLDRALLVGTHSYTLCTTEKQYQALLKGMRIPKAERAPFLVHEYAGATIHFFENKGDRTRAAIVCIRVTGEQSWAQVVALLAHEAVHLWQEIREALGEKQPSAEEEAYAIQSLVQRLIEELVRQTGTTKQLQGAIEAAAKRCGTVVSED